MQSFIYGWSDNKHDDKPSDKQMNFQNSQPWVFIQSEIFHL